MTTGGVAETSFQATKEVVTASGVRATSTETGKEITVSTGRRLTCTGSSKEVVTAGEAGSCGQATHIVTGATHVECRRTATYQATIDV